MNPIHGLWNPYHRQTHREFIPRPDHFKFWALQCSLLHPSFRYLHPSPEHYSSGVLVLLYFSRRQRKGLRLRTSSEEVKGCQNKGH